MTPSISIIVAMTRRRAIGLRGDMPWKMDMKCDLKYFKTVTMGHPIIMGRKTFESLPNGPLPGRLNIVLTSQKSYQANEGVIVAHSIEEALEAAKGEDELFVLGGAKLFSQTLHLAQKLYITYIESNNFLEADTFFPEVDPDNWTLQSKERHEADERNRYPYTFTVWMRK